MSKSYLCSDNWYPAFSVCAKTKLGILASYSVSQRAVTIHNILHLFSAVFKRIILQDP